VRVRSEVAKSSRHGGPEGVAAGPKQARLALRETPETVTLSWRGDERIELVLSKEKGVMEAPVAIRVGGRELTFGGFYVVMNEVRATRKPKDGGEGSGLGVRPRLCAPVRTQAQQGRAVFEHLLAHPKLKSRTRVRAEVWMAPGDKAIRFRISARGAGQHLDRLGWGDFKAAPRGEAARALRSPRSRGQSISARRLFFATNLVMNAPIKPFDVRYDRRTTRFWCIEMQNGLAVMQGADSPPRGYAFDSRRGRYDLYTYCDNPITYTLVVTGKGPQEAIEQFRRTPARPGVEVAAPPSLHKLPGRVALMAAYPIAERYEDFFEAFAGRGARDFVWLSYCPNAGDRAILDRLHAIYATYDTYFDLWHEGPRKAEVWSPDMVKYYECGAMERGYWDSTRNLPELYIHLAETRKQGVFGIEFRNAAGERDFLPTETTKISNLVQQKRIARPNGMYLDVHASRTPRHYFDHLGRHHSMAENMKWERRLFRFTRRFLGNAPIWSEGGNEAWVGVMDGGMFVEWHPPEEFGISCADWELYPFVDQVHRERMLTMGVSVPRADADPEAISAAILAGRPQFIGIYYGADQSDVASRLKLYYLTSAFHRMLGLSKLERVEFVGGDLHRQHHFYSNGAQVWVNRGEAEWRVKGRTLPQYGYLVEGPACGPKPYGGQRPDFMQCRARIALRRGRSGVRAAPRADSVFEVVRSPDYDYFACDQSFDFGPVITQGAVAIRREKRAKCPLRRLTIYEIVKARHITLRLGEIPGTDGRQRAARAWVMLTRGRRVELTFPNLQQEGSLIHLRGAEMPTVLAYQVDLAP